VEGQIYSVGQTLNDLKGHDVNVDALRTPGGARAGPCGFAFCRPRLNAQIAPSGLAMKLFGINVEVTRYGKLPALHMGEADEPTSSSRTKGPARNFRDGILVYGLDGAFVRPEGQ
jgi:hypothetical protein